MTEEKGKFNYAYVAESIGITEALFVDPWLSKWPSVVDRLAASLKNNCRLSPKEVNELHLLWSVAVHGQFPNAEWPRSLYTSADQLQILHSLYFPTSLIIITAASLLSFPNADKLLESGQWTREWQAFQAVAKLKWPDKPLRQRRSNRKLTPAQKRGDTFLNWTESKKLDAKSVAAKWNREHESDASAHVDDVLVRQDILRARKRRDKS